MIPTELQGALARLVEVAFVGRVLLSVLPPGLPGRHEVRGIGATWAASHVLGTIVLGAQGAIASGLGVEIGRIPHLAPWLLVGLGRWITLPARMVPRHEPLARAPGPASTAIAALTAVAVAVGAAIAARGRGAAGLEAAADVAAATVACGFGLATARRAPLARAIAIALLAGALLAGLAGGDLQALRTAMLLGSGAAFAVGWLRRGDRRGAALSVLALAGAGLAGPREAVLGAAGLFALVVHTPTASRSRVLRNALSTLAPAIAIGWWTHPRPEAAATALPPLGVAAIFVVALALARRAGLVRAREARVAREAQAAPGAQAVPESTTGLVDPPRAERDAARDAAIVSLVFLAARGELSSSDTLATALLPLAPLVALELGLALGRPETALDREPSPTPARR